MSMCCRGSSYVVVGAVGVCIGLAVSSKPEFETPSSSVEATAVALVQPEEMSPDDMMRMMQEWGAPGAEHEALAMMAGEWDCTTRFWMGPGDPIVSKAKSTNNVVLGGRFVTQHFSIPEFMGMEYEGMGAVGFDKTAGKFVSVWLDNTKTVMATMHGTYDEDTRTFTWTGKAVTAMGETDAKHVVKHINDDKMIMEFYEPDPATGKMRRNGEIIYNRSH